MTSTCQNVGKSSWPELVGVAGDTAVAIIEKENPAVMATVVPQGSFVTLDLRCDRVRVFVDASCKVVQIPVVG